MAAPQPPQDPGSDDGEDDDGDDPDERDERRAPKRGGRRKSSRIRTGGRSTSRRVAAGAGRRKSGRTTTSGRRAAGRGGYAPRRSGGGNGVLIAVAIVVVGAALAGLVWVAQTGGAPAHEVAARDFATAFCSGDGQTLVDYWYFPPEKLAGKSEAEVAMIKGMAAGLMSGFAGAFKGAGAQLQVIDVRTESASASEARVRVTLRDPGGGGRPVKDDDMNLTMVLVDGRWLIDMDRSMGKSR